MKKIIFSAAMLLAVWTTAQNTGINTTTPQATLDVKAKSANTTADQEGLLIPRVSKNKAALMAASATSPTESTLIYVNDLTDYTTTPVDAPVADITENGYYSWNGTKWLKITPIRDPWYNIKTNTPASTLAEDIYHQGHVSIGTPYKTTVTSLIGNKEIASIGFGNNHGLVSTLGNGGGNIYNASNNGDVEPFIKKWSETGERDISLLNYTSVNMLLGSFMSFDYKSAWETNGTGSGGSGMSAWTDGEITANSKPSRLEFVTTSINENLPFTRLTIKNNGNIGIATTTPTEKLDVNGNIKTSSLAGTGDRIVVADANGVLKTGTTTLPQAISKWTNDSANQVVKLTNLSDGATARTDEHNIFIKDNGYFGIGTVPQSLFHLSSQSGGLGNDILFDFFNAGPADPLTFYISRYNGTQNSPTNMIDGDYLFNLVGRGLVNNSISALSSFGMRYKGDGISGLSDFYIGVSGDINDIYIKENHLVGIGTVTPTEKLEVAGNVKANRAIFTNLPVYADDAAADADTALPSGSLYKLQNTGRQVFVKP